MGARPAPACARAPALVASAGADAGTDARRNDLRLLLGVCTFAPLSRRRRGREPQEEARGPQGSSGCCCSGDLGEVGGGGGVKDLAAKGKNGEARI